MLNYERVDLSGLPAFEVESRMLIHANTADPWMDNFLAARNHHELHGFSVQH